MGYMFLPLGRYFDFSGRSRRLEYWLFMLLQTIVLTVLLGMVFAALIEAVDSDGVMRDDGEAWFWSTQGGLVPLILVCVFWLLFIIPTIAVQVRRFHDQDKSGAWVLINFIPLGSFVVLVMMFLDGTPGPNQDGPDPKNRQPLQYGHGAPGGYPPHQAGGYPPQQGDHPSHPVQPPQQGGSGWPAPGSHDPNARPLG